MHSRSVSDVHGVTQCSIEVRSEERESEVTHLMELCNVAGICNLIFSQWVSKD
jgi:hypothetical protein